MLADFAPLQAAAPDVIRGGFDDRLASGRDRRLRPGRGAVLVTLQRLEPPAPIAVAMVRQAAAARALRNNDADALPARILQRAKPARTSQSVAVQRFGIAAPELDNQRISRVGGGRPTAISSRARVPGTA